MKVPILGFVLAAFLLLNGVNSDSPLQYDPTPLFPDHTYGHGPNGAGLLEFSTKARLPGNVLPTHYDLRIRPILDEVPGLDLWSAPGSVKITVTVKEATNVIFLHAAAELDVDEDAIVVRDVENPAEPFVVTVTRDPAAQSLQIDLDKQLVVDGTYTIEIDFVAPVAVPPNLDGLYRTSYTRPDGTTSYLAITQFEAISARQMFPCFDEPWMKAKVKITLGYLKTKYVALANGDAVNGEEEEIPGAPEGWVWQGYEETVDMSTYLIAIVIAEFDYAASDPALYDKTVRTYGPPHAINDNNGGQYSADTGAKILAFFEDEYGIDYKLSKMDQAAVQDFGFGAMENWGLNIYRESALLYFPGESTEQNRNSVTGILAHELAHQWFGNLVTCGFWDHIYLNEGFATYNEYIATDAVYPEFESLKIRVPDTVQRAMVFDASPQTHPIINAANGDDNTGTIMAYFDRITYQKGGSVIRMMEGFLGKDTFKQALTEYLTEMSFKGAYQDDLFRVLTARAHEEDKIPDDKTIKDIMDTWTLQSGFPIVSVSRASDTRVFISQSRFSSNAEFATVHELDPNDLWEIPISIASAEEPDFANHSAKLWLEKNIALRSYEIDTSRWLVLNPEATGYYRVMYDQHLLRLLLQQYTDNMNVISPLSRSQIFDDYYTFAMSNYISIETALDFTKHLGKENELVVWSTAFTHLRPVFNRLSGTAAFDEFRQFYGPQIVDALTLIGLEQLPEHKGANVILRLQLLDLACALDRPECLQYAARLFAEWDAEPEGDLSKVPLDIQQVIFCGAVSGGGADAYEKVKARYVLDATPAKYRTYYLNALGCAQDPAILASLRDEVLGSGELKSIPDRIVALQRLAANSHSRGPLIPYLRDNAVTLIGALQANSISSTVSTLSTYVGTQEELDSINTLIQENAAVLEAVMPSLRASVAAIEANIAWRNKYESRLHEWFQLAKV